MISDSARQGWDYIVVWKLDRFARNRQDSALYKMRLRKNGVQVKSATETISDNPEGIILESVLEGIAEYYSADLSLKIRRGMRDVGEIGAIFALHIAAAGQQIGVGHQLLRLVAEKEVHERLGVVHVGGRLEDHGREGVDHRTGGGIVDVQGARPWPWRNRRCSPLRR